MDERELQTVFEHLGVDDFALRGEVREFTRLDPQAQLAWLFVEVKLLKRGNSHRGHLLNAIYATMAAVTAALVAAAGGVPVPPFGIGPEGP